MIPTMIPTLRLTLVLLLVLGHSNDVSAWSFSKAPVARRKRPSSAVVNSQPQRPHAKATQECWTTAKANDDGKSKASFHDHVSATQMARNKLQGSFAVVLSAALVLTAPPAGAADVARGQELFGLTCAGCHQGGQNFVSETKTLQPDALQRNLGGTDPATIERFVLNSNQHKNLVFFRLKTNSGKLTPEEYTDVFAFVSDQAQNDKW